jgi:hypothetical protein
MLLGVALAVVSLMSNCNGDEEHRREVADYRKKLIEMEKSGIIAGPSEPTFEEKHGVKLHLPLSEADFLRILETLKLERRVMAERGSNEPIPPLWHAETLKHPLKLDDVQRVYQVLGEVDKARKSQEVYRAYIDKNGFLVYLENTYWYSPP